MVQNRAHFFAAFAVCGVTFAASRAWAIPSFSRKYGTSCQTCHTVYPKLNPFGEAFRRNGFRFPGTDSDYVREARITLGEDKGRKEFPKATWPGTLPASVPLSFGVNGAATIHPDVHSGAAKADNGTVISVKDLVGEAHIWAGGSFSERITFFGELVVSTEPSVALEHAIVLFTDIFKLKHAINLVVGKTAANLTGFGAHSSYVADGSMPGLAVTSLFGGTSDAWVLPGNATGIEVNGVIGGHFMYAAGYNAGTNVDVRNSQNVYANAGFKLGGMRLDGEPSGFVGNAERPWEETALTLDAFFYRSSSRFSTPSADPTVATDVVLNDSAISFGANVRGQWRSLELNSGVYQERHNHVLADGTAVNALAQYNELSYVIWPWLVPAFRVEYVRLDVGAGGPTLYEWRFTPGIAALILQNLKVTLAAQFEYAQGAPDAGWGAAGGFAAPSAPNKHVGEIESITLGMAYAF